MQRFIYINAFQVFQALLNISLFPFLSSKFCIAVLPVLNLQIPDSLRVFNVAKLFSHCFTPPRLLEWNFQANIFLRCSIERRNQLAMQDVQASHCRDGKVRNRVMPRSINAIGTIHQNRFRIVPSLSRDASGSRDASHRVSINHFVLVVSSLRCCRASEIASPSNLQLRSRVSTKSIESKRVTPALVGTGAQRFATRLYSTGGGL